MGPRHGARALQFRDHEWQDWAGVDRRYAMLLVHDTRLNAPAYGAFLDEEFRRLLSAVPQGKRVLPLVIMTIADLENLESSIAGFSMRQLLADYVAAHPEGLVSLHNFMVLDARYADKLQPSAQLMNDSARLIALAQRELFPRSPELKAEGQVPAPAATGNDARTLGQVRTAQSEPPPRTCCSFSSCRPFTRYIAVSSEQCR